MAIYYSQGLYQMEVTEQRLGKTSNGNPQWVVRGKIQNRVHDDGSTEPAQAQYDRTIYRVITDKTVPYLMEDLEALGCPGIESFGQLDQGHAQCFDLRGQWITVQCKHGEYQGNGREEWSFFADRTSSLEVTPLNAQEVRNLNNMFGKALKGMKPATNGKPAAAQPAQKQTKPAGMVSSPKPRPAPVAAGPSMDPDIPAPTDDDLPF